MTTRSSLISHFQPRCVARLLGASNEKPPMICEKKPKFASPNGGSKSFKKVPKRRPCMYTRHSIIQSFILFRLSRNKNVNSNNNRTGQQDAKVHLYSFPQIFTDVLVKTESKVAVRWRSSEQKSTVFGKELQTLTTS